MPNWKYYLNRDLWEREELERMRFELDSTQIDATGLQRISRQLNERLSALEQKVDLQALLIEALLRILETRARLDRNEIELMMQKVDLEDGVEDGALGEDRSAAAPRCSACGKPVNPRRAACIYCRAPLPLSPQKSAPAPAPARTMIKCANCGASIAESDAFYSELGKLCMHCFHQL